MRVLTDETTDVDDRFIVNIIIGKLNLSLFLKNCE